MLVPLGPPSPRTPIPFSFQLAFLPSPPFLPFPSATIAFLPSVASRPCLFLFVFPLPCHHVTLSFFLDSPACRSPPCPSEWQCMMVTSFLGTRRFRRPSVTSKCGVWLLSHSNVALCGPRSKNFVSNVVLGLDPWSPNLVLVPERWPLCGVRPRSWSPTL